MHHRLLVTTRNATSSEDARWAVTNGLIDQGFVNDPTTRWSGGVADWFVIGGRFSGQLAGLNLVEQFDRCLTCELGSEDDARLVTGELYERFLEDYEGLTESDGFADLEHEPVSHRFIGKKWLVVVDYHD